MVSGKKADHSWKNTDISFDYGNKAYSAPIFNNLILKSLSTADIKNQLNELPGLLAYWGALKISIEIEQEKAKDEYEEWYQECYMEVDDGYPKKTEGWKKSKVMMDNPAESRDWKERFREFRNALGKLGSLLSGYNAQVWTLREIARVTTVEMNNIEIRGSSGRGSLADL